MFLRLSHVLCKFKKKIALNDNKGTYFVLKESHHFKTGRCMHIFFYFALGAIVLQSFIVSTCSKLRPGIHYTLEIPASRVFLCADAQLLWTSLEGCVSRFSLEFRLWFFVMRKLSTITDFSLNVYHLSNLKQRYIMKLMIFFLFSVKQVIQWAQCQKQRKFYPIIDIIRHQGWNTEKPPR